MVLYDNFCRLPLKLVFFIQSACIWNPYFKKKLDIYLLFHNTLYICYSGGVWEGLTKRIWFFLLILWVESEKTSSWLNATKWRSLPYEVVEKPIKNNYFYFKSPKLVWPKRQYEPEIHVNGNLVPRFSLLTFALWGRVGENPWQEVSGITQTGPVLKSWHVFST